MGGTFDPIHHGHLVAASEVATRFHLDEVVFVPTGQPWQKVDRHVSAAEDRYLMTVIATASNPRFTVSRVDIDRPGMTYTVDTLRDLHGERGDDVDLYFITGADALAQILTWRDVDKLFDLAHFVGCTRPGVDLVSPAIAQLPQDRVTLDGDPGSGDFVDGVPRTGRHSGSDLVPGAGRDRAVHRQTRALPDLSQGQRARPSRSISTEVRTRRARVSGVFASKTFSTCQDCLE